jgi:DNA-binding transcriptional LysR family regulator
MRLTLDALLVLDAIDRKGSFAAAANYLHRVPSAVSYTVQKLEQDLDLELFDRSGHRANLTSAGRELLEQGRNLLAAASELEARVKRVATGWETELRIAVDNLIPLHKLFPIISDFYASDCGTRLRLSREILSGSWEALITGRADLIVGVTGDVPSSSEYASVTLGEIEMVFVVAPDHPLADAPEPISKKDVLKHRAIAVADTSRTMTPRTMELLSGQDVLTVPDMATKVRAHCFGLGVGTIPKSLAEVEQAQGRLKIMATEGETIKPKLQAAWRTAHRGRALKWFVDRLQDPQQAAYFIS